MTNNVAHMEAEGLSIFADHLSRSKVYLEYGCGKSTEYACSLPSVEHVISVESDKSWSDMTFANIENKSKLHLGYVNIGEVGEWGRPKNNQKILDYHKYMLMPWVLAAKYELEPDLILVDGRFRVASFLYSLLTGKSGATILFDDYVNRKEQYGVVENFIKPVGTHGRLAEFLIEKNFNQADITAVIAKYSIISE